MAIFSRPMSVSLRVEWITAFPPRPAIAVAPILFLLIILEIYFDLDVDINGDTSTVTLFDRADMEYTLNDVERRPEELQIEEDVSIEVYHEIGDVIRDYFDYIAGKYGLIGDLIEFDLMTDKGFKESVRESQN